MFLKTIKENKVTVFIFGYLLTLLIVLVVFLVIIYYIVASLDDNSDPKKWTPFFNFYRTFSCMEKTDNYKDNCFILGIRSNQTDTSLITNLNSLNLIFEGKKVDFSNWQCREFDSKRIIAFTEGAPLGSSYECWSREPLSEDFNLKY